MVHDPDPYQLSDIVARLRGGDALALRDLMDRYYPQLVDIAVIYTKNSDAAEDVVQTVLISIWDKRGQLPPAGEVVPYLVAAVRNRAISHHRALSTRQRYHNSAGMDASQPAAATNDALANLVTADLHARLDREIEALPPRCREIFRLSREGKLSYQEIGEVLGISPNTVRVQIAKALDLLRRDLQGWITE